MQVFDGHVLAATHPRAQRPGQRSTLVDHLPPEAQAWSLADPQHCLATAEAIGPCCRRVVESLFADRVLDKLRAAQGVLRLANYRTIKTILARGLDQHSGGTTEPAADSAIYSRGGRFCRTPSHRIH